MAGSENDERENASAVSSWRRAMTAFAGAVPVAGGIGGLNFFLRGELAAVNAWQHALRSAEGRRPLDVLLILAFASEHQRTVAALQLVVRELGGVPASEAATDGAFAPLVETATVRGLLEGEKSGLTMYEAADGTFEGDARDLVTYELIPRQRRHVAELSAILSRPPPAADLRVGEAAPVQEGKA
jgi:hypothetical protein